MDNRQSPPSLPPAGTRDQEIVDNLRRIEKRDWWIWANSIFVMLLLTGALISFALPSLLQGATTLFRIKVTEAIFGLVFLIVVFNIYTIYQQVLIKRLRRQLAEKQNHSMILRGLAMIDALTGLYNRRFAEQRLAAEVARSARKGHPLTVVLLDLDEFKYINDTYGHPAGDLVLQEFAAALNRAIRGGDLAVRMGGDEFALLLDDIAGDELGRRIDQFREMIRATGRQICGEDILDASFGAAFYPKDGATPDELLTVADRIVVLYRGRIMGSCIADPARRAEIGAMMAGQAQ